MVHIARANHTAVFPARVMLVGAMNPCPCGFHGSAQRPCRCPAPAVERYRRRLSGPLRDRFDLSIEIPAVPWADLRATTAGESSSAVRARVLTARVRQLARQACLNARLDGRALRAACALNDREAEGLLANGVSKLRLSARAVMRVLRVARTIADLEGTASLTAAHLAEALQWRLTEQPA
jgi:magnesium chelatase family protein